MNSHFIQRKIEKVIDEFKLFVVTEYGKWRIDRGVARGFLRDALIYVAELAVQEERERVIKLIEAKIDNYNFKEGVPTCAALVALKIDIRNGIINPLPTKHLNMSEDQNTQATGPVADAAPEAAPAGEATENPATIAPATDAQ